jgi:putative transposase
MRIKRGCYVHLVWATKNREKSIPQSQEYDLYRLIVSEAQEFRCQVLAINGMPDHVHVLLQMSSTVSFGQLLHQMKGVSSAFLNEDKRLDLDHPRFRWQEGYGMFSVAPDRIENVIRYIEAQKEHHAQQKTWSDWETTPEDEYQQKRATTTAAPEVRF